MSLFFKSASSLTAYPNITLLLKLSPGIPGAQTLRVSSAVAQFPFALFSFIVLNKMLVERNVSDFGCFQILEYLHVQISYLGDRSQV
jgi:hypothetical protein